MINEQNVRDRSRSDMSDEHQKARELFEDFRKLWSPDKPDSQANCLHRMVRPVFISVPVGTVIDPDGAWPTTQYAEKTAWHHGWTQAPRCAVGDGSSIYHQTLAIVEMSDGRVEYIEPHLVRFLPN